MNDNQDRLMDQIIEEAVRKNGPPDLRARIMAAASNKAANTPRIYPPNHKIDVLGWTLTRAISAIHRFACLSP